MINKEVTTNLRPFFNFFISSLLVWTLAHADRAAAQSESSRVGQLSITSLSTNYQPISTNIEIQENDAVTEGYIVSPAAQLTYIVEEAGSLQTTSQKNKLEVSPWTWSSGIYSEDYGATTDLLSQTTSYTLDQHGGLAQTRFQFSTETNQGPSTEQAVFTSISQIRTGFSANAVEQAIGFQENSLQGYIFSLSSSPDATMTMSNTQELLEGSARFSFRSSRLQPDLQVTYSLNSFQNNEKPRDIYVLIGEAIPAHYDDRDVTIVFTKIDLINGKVSGTIIDNETGKMREFEGTDKDTTKNYPKTIDLTEIIFELDQLYLPLFYNQHALTTTYLSSISK